MAKLPKPRVGVGMTRVAVLKMLALLVVCVLVATYLVVGSHWERQRGYYLRYRDMVCLLRAYVCTTDGRWPASIDELKDMGLIGSEPVDGFYRFPAEPPLVVRGECLFAGARRIPVSYVESLNYGVIQRFDEIELKDAALCRKRDGREVQLFRLDRLDYGRPYFEALPYAMYDYWYDDVRSCGQGEGNGQVRGGGSTSTQAQGR